VSVIRKHGPAPGTSREIHPCVRIYHPAVIHIRRYAVRKCAPEGNDFEDFPPPFLRKHPFCDLGQPYAPHAVIAHGALR